MKTILMLTISLLAYCQLSGQEATDNAWNHEVSIMYNMGKASSTADAIIGLGFIYQGLYWYRPKLAALMGTGAENFNLENGELIIPVFAGAKYILSENKNSVFASAITGYGIATSFLKSNLHGARGGFMLHPKVGYELLTPTELVVNFAIGYRYQKATFTIWEGIFGESLTRNYEYHRISFHTGIIF